MRLGTALKREEERVMKRTQEGKWEATCSVNHFLFYVGFIGKPRQRTKWKDGNGSSEDPNLAD